MTEQAALVVKCDPGADENIIYIKLTIYYTPYNTVPGNKYKCWNGFFVCVKQKKNYIKMLLHSAK